MDTTSDARPLLADPNGLASYLQSKVENERAELTRQLHDNLGGFLVAALMDTAWAEQHWTLSASQAQEKLKRVRHSLGAAIDLKRKLIESLRPTLLDNFGLFAALSWQLKQSATAHSIQTSDTFPATEPPLDPDTAIALYRYVEEAIHLSVEAKNARRVDLNVTVDDRDLTIRVSHDGKAFSDADKSDQPEFASLRHRIGRLGGELEMLQGNGDAGLLARVPIAKG